MPSFTFEGSISGAEQWLPFAIAQRINYLASGIKATNIAPEEGVLIMIREHHIHIKASPPFIFSAGFKHSIAISDGRAWVSGNNVSGQLGLGDELNRYNFVDTEIKASKVSAGGNHSVLISKGVVWSAGLNSYGQLSRNPYVDESLWGDTGFEAKAVSAGNNFTNAIKEVQVGDSTLSMAYGAGRGDLGCTGVPIVNLDTIFIGGIAYAVSPVYRETGKQAVKISAGISHTLALLDGEVWVTGDSFYGAFGTGVDRVKRFEFINTGVVADDIAAGREFSLIIKTGTVWSCGLNQNGQLGLGDTNNRNVFTDTGIAATQISAGRSHSLCVSDGAIMGCGYNDQGQLGLGFNSNSEALFRNSVDENGGVIAASKVSAGGYHSLASSNGRLLSSGYNIEGQLEIGRAHV